MYVKEHLWKEYFRDPSQWWDNRRSKASPLIPDFKHKSSKHSLWIHGSRTPSWVHEKLRTQSLSDQQKQHNEEETHENGVLRIPHHLIAEDAAFLALLRACAKQKDVCRGIRAHADILKSALLEKSSYVANTLVSMYAKCGDLVKARRMLEELPAPNVVSWSALIAGYAQQGQGQNALDCFRRMQRKGLSPDAVTFTCILKACGSIGAIDSGDQIHNEIAKQGLLGKDLVLGNALVDMYAKCGSLAKAKKVLEELPLRDVISWSALIAGYAQHGQGQEALSCFKMMQDEGLSPDAVTFMGILKACSSIQSLDMGEQIHDEIARRGLLKTKIELGNALVDMYTKCGALAKAQRVLEELPVRDVVSWNALIAGYAEQGQGEEALSCYEQMQCEGLDPNVVTFLCILKACGSIGSAEKGKQVHDDIVKQGLLGNDIMLATALVDMYLKCGALTKAEQLFDKFPIRDVVLWSALIAGCAQQGQHQNALKYFERMQCKGLSPDGVTMSCVLNASSHAGQVDKGQMYFAMMSAEYGIAPNVEHYTCMVDMYGRAGHFDKAMAFIERMPSVDCPTVWYALLGACQKWGEVSIAKWAFEHAIQLDTSDAATYVCMANIYAAAGMHKEAETVRAMRLKSKAQIREGFDRWIKMSDSSDSH